MAPLIYGLIKPTILLPASLVSGLSQREIEMVAEQMEQHFAALMPLTYETFNANGRVAP